MKLGKDIPRVRGSAFQREDKLWSWEMVVTIGDMLPEDGLCMAYPEKSPGFISKEVALTNLKEFLPGVIQAVCTAYGVEKPDGYIDLKKNQFTKEINL